MDLNGSKNEQSVEWVQYSRFIVTQRNYGRNGNIMRVEITTITLSVLKIDTLRHTHGQTI